MFLRQPVAGWRSLFPRLGLMIIPLLAADARAEPSALTEASMAEAIGFFAVLADRDISADDKTWLKRQWREEHAGAPEAVAAQVEDLAFAFETYRRDDDALALAQSRAAVLKNVYCTSAQSSDPAIRRLKDILAPEDVVLAADCLLGLVVTRFDAEGLVASHALLAAAAGRPHDVEGDMSDVVAAIRNGFADAAPAEKSVLANGELRHAVLARYWSRIEGTQRKRAFLDEVRKAELTDLRSPARQLEDLAIKDISAVDYLTKAGETRLTASAIDDYVEWLEPIAGYGFSGRDRDWLQQVIIDEFRRDPRKVMGEIAGVREMNRDRILADTADERRGMVDGWAGALFCVGSASDDPNERRLVEVVFRHDPVIDADCSAQRVTRERHRVLAETKGERLREQDLDVGLRFLRMILGRPLLSEEEAVVREDTVRSFREDPEAFRKRNEEYRTILAEVEQHDTSVFLGMDKRKELFDPIYCALKESDEAYADAYFEMFRRNGAIVYENCDEQVVTTEDELDAFVGFSNFLAMLNGRPPFDQAATDEIRQSVASLDLDDVEVAMSAVKEWWSLLNLEQRIIEAKNVRDQAITPEGDASSLNFFINMVKLDVVNRNSMRQACMLESVIQQGRVAQFAARSGAFTLSERGGELGIPGSDLENIVFSSSLFGSLCQGL